MPAPADPYGPPAPALGGGRPAQAASWRLAGLAMAAAVMLTAAACLEPAETTSLTETTPLEEDPDGGMDYSPWPQGETASSALVPGEEREIASGEADGVVWRLLEASTPIDLLPQVLCLQMERPGELPIRMCHSSDMVVESRDEGRWSTRCTGPPGDVTCSPQFEGTSQGPAAVRVDRVLALPGFIRHEPRFVFGAIGDDAVARVVVEMEDGGQLEAAIVGEARAHYVAVLPQGPTPVEVVAYGAGGQELDRRGLSDEVPPEEVEHQEEECGYAQDGSYVCRNSMSGSGGGSASGGIHESSSGGEEGRDEAGP